MPDGSHVSPRRTPFTLGPGVSLALAIALVAGVAWVAFFAELGSTSLVENAEPLFAQASREMLDTGDWITPRIHGTPRFDKPALMYWLIASAYSKFGVTEWAVRLPSAVAGCATVFAVFAALLTWGRGSPQRRAWIAALGASIAALNVEAIFWARVGVADMLLAACISGTLLAFFWARVRSSSKACLLSFALAALAVLAKGPVGIVLPALVVGVFLWVTRSWKAALKELPLGTGLGLFAAITLPWYGLVIYANGWRFVQEFIGYHNLYRYTHVVERQSGPWYFYLIVIAVFLAPWSVFLPSALARSRFWRRREWQPGRCDEQLSVFAATWFLTVLVFFSLAATKLHNYVLPLVPAAAILIALHTQSLTSASADAPRGWRLEGWISVGTAAGLGFLLWWGPERLAHARDTSFPAMPAFLGSLVPSAAARQNLLETGRQMQRAGAHRWALLICLASGCAKSLAILARRPLWLVAINGVAWMAFLAMVLGPVARATDDIERRPIQELSIVADALQRPGEPIFVVGVTQSVVTFYSQRLVQFQPGIREVLSEMARSAQPSALVLTDMRAWGDNTQAHVLLKAVGSYELIRLVLVPAAPGWGGSGPAVNRH